MSNLNINPHLYCTKADIERAKSNVKRLEWAKKYYYELLSEADKWVRKSDDEIRARIPAPGSRFAYGFSGCPVCGADWKWWGAAGIASFDMPGKVTCPSCKHNFPDADHPDDGDGWRDPEDGRIYYLLGIYNAYAAQEITLKALRALSTLYALTEDQSYSHTAAVLFDSLAHTYSASTEGSADYPSSANSGRFERPFYQVARVLVHLADYLDLLCTSPDFSKSSKFISGSIKENVEENIIRNGGNYCYEEAESGWVVVMNGQADYVRGVLVAGIMLNEKEWIDYVLSGPYSFKNFLDSCLDIDGQYYETSIGYSEWTMHIFRDIAEILCNYRSPEHPNGINFYNIPRFKKALGEAPSDIDCLGHTPSVGDYVPDFSVIDSDQYSFSAHLNAEFLAARAETDQERAYWRAFISKICHGDVESRRADSKFDDIRHWLLFHADYIPNPENVPEYEPCAVLSGRGIAILRSGMGKNGCAAHLRYGPSLAHGHLDDLGLNVYALGREITYDLGYGLACSHVQLAWARQTASHNLVVVNEKSQQIETGTGGSIYFNLNSESIKAVEASSEASYASENVRMYRRTLAQVDLPSGDHYILDIFRVHGGHQHDLMWHFCGEMDDPQGVQLGAEEPGSLAGREIEWGTKVGACGDLVGCSDKSYTWIAPPGNGYGFLHGIRRSKNLSNDISIRWNIESGESITAILLPEPNSELITAQAPGILPDYPKADYAILRRQGEDLQSSFASLIWPSFGDKKALSAKRLQHSAGPESSAVGVQIITPYGTDYILNSLTREPIVFHTDAGDIAFSGRFGFVRVADEKVIDSALIDGNHLSFGDFELKQAESSIDGIVTAVDYQQLKLKLNCCPNVDLEGKYIYINHERYSHNSPYTIKQIIPEENSVIIDGDFVISRGRIGGKTADESTLTSVFPLPRAMSLLGTQTGYYKGKLIENIRTGESTTIVDVESDMHIIKVAETHLFSPGDSFSIYDVQLGDEYIIY